MVNDHVQQTSPGQASSAPLGMVGQMVTAAHVTARSLGPQPLSAAPAGLAAQEVQGSVVMCIPRKRSRPTSSWDLCWGWEAASSSWPYSLEP